MSYRDTQYVSDKGRKEKGQGKTERNGLQDYPVKELRLREVKALAPGHMTSKEQSWGSHQVGHCQGLYRLLPRRDGRKQGPPGDPDFTSSIPRAQWGWRPQYGKTTQARLRTTASRNQGQRKQSGRESVPGTNKTISNSGAILHLKT